MLQKLESWTHFLKVTATFRTQNLIPCGTKFLREFIFADQRFFFVFRELIFAIRADWFFRLGINFTIFRKYPVPSVDNIFIFIEYIQQKCILSNNTTVCVDISLYTALFLNERDKTQLNRHDFLVLYFCVVNLSQRILIK